VKHLAYLSLGSNLGHREDRLREAIARLGALGTVVSVSSLYETEPVEFTAQPWFLNCAVALETTDLPEDLLKKILAIEGEMGRKRAIEQNKGPRTIDIDILLYDEMTLDSPSLTVPHPAMQHRRFVLAPLAEIAPHARHPRLNRSVEQVLAALPAGQAVSKLSSSEIHTNWRG